jgi:periplasmic divalent cation tolerance protein
MADELALTLIYVPCASEGEAQQIAATLLEERLIACANIYESRSLYRWNGALADEREFVLVCKSSPLRATQAEERILALHSYELPCVLQLETVRANRAYAQWVHDEVSAQPTAAGDMPQ